MALMFPSKKKSGFKETTLWTNSSPTSSFSGDITVSSIHGYSYIKIYFRYSTSLNETSEVIFPWSIFYYGYVGFGMRKSDSSTINDMRYRCCYAKSYTTINFANSVAHQSASQTTSGAYIIPTKITGLNFT